MGGVAKALFLGLIGICWTVVSPSSVGAREPDLGRVKQCKAMSAEMADHSPEDIKVCLDDVLDHLARFEKVVSRELQTRSQKPSAGGLYFSNLDSERRRKYSEAYYDFQVAKQDITVRAYNNQRLSGNIVLGVVIVLVLSGVSFSILQFYAAIKGVGLGAQTTSPTLGEAGDSNGVNHTVNFEISREKMVVRTSFIGFAVIALSFLFFISYLILVFPINYTR